MNVTAAARWVLTREAFDGFLARLDPDRERAGALYEEIRLTLATYFRVNGCSDVEALADETLDRAARRLTEIDVVDVRQFVRGVARNVICEVRRAPRSVTLHDVADLRQAAPKDFVEPEARELRLRCLETCVKRCSPEMRALALEYYQHDKAEKIANKRRMAERFGISLGALRVRALRARRELECCLRRCLQAETSVETFSPNDH
jgi:DNA-directed RNA polymerase specialized sigma24 family protein